MASQIPLNIYFLPYPAPGHLTPLCEMARLFAARGQLVTVITTPSNAKLLHHSLSVHVVQFPNLGLPDGVENLISATDLQSATKIYKAVAQMRDQIEAFIISNPPDCIISDMYYPWTSGLAAQLRIPRILFQSCCVFAHCLDEAMRPANPDAPHHHVESDYKPFEVPGLPDRVVMTRSQLPDWVRTPNGYTLLMEHHREAEKKSYGIVVNSFYEMEPDYTEHYGKLMGHKIYHIGPASLIHHNAEDKAQRGYKPVVGEHECLGWLDSKKTGSVLYVCFGGSCRFPDEQLYEIASGLASSGAQFIWVVLGKDSDSDSDTSKWLPDGFEKEMKLTGRGMIIRGWAPQVLILSHRAIGGFMTHCGWNSVVEALSNGVPMVTWPLYAEQFYNEKLLTQVLKIGVEVGVKDFWNLWVDVDMYKVVMIKRERIEAVVRWLMMDDGGDEAAQMRRRVVELREKARKALQEGGSSHRNLTALIQDLQRLRAINSCSGV